MISPMYQDLSQKIWGLQVREWRRVGQEWGTFEKLSVLVTFSPSQAGFKTLYPIKMYDLDENFCIKSCHYTLQHGVYGVQQVARPKL